MAPPRSDLWKSVYPRLLLIARRYARTVADAEDLAQQALAESFARMPNPTDLASLLAYAAAIARNQSLTRARDAARRADERWLDGAAGATGREVRTPEDEVLAREGARRSLAALQARIGDDPVALAIVDCVLRGDETPAEWVAATGYDIEAIRNGRKRIARHVAALRGDGGETAPGVNGEISEPAEATDR
ncbi:MAG TPA: sigma factor [Polyangiaceae bacterium]|nr:sigma factor [Polyangiaceae bacterium]